MASKQPMHRSSGVDGCCSPEEAMTMETGYSSGRRRPHISLLSVPDFSFVGLHRRLCPTLSAIFGASPCFRVWSWRRNPWFVELRGASPSTTCMRSFRARCQRSSVWVSSSPSTASRVLYSVGRLVFRAHSVFWHPLRVLASSQALLQLEYVKLARSSK